MAYQQATEQIRTISTALIAFYRKRWVEWGQSDDRQLLDHLYVMEFRAADCDTDELFEAFVKANEALERKAYGCGQHHFGIGYLARRPDREGDLIRALVMVQPDHVEAFRIAADEITRSRFDIMVTKCEIDAGDPDAQWRWLAEGVIGSTAMFDDGEPRFAVLGRYWAFESHSGQCDSSVGGRTSRARSDERQPLLPHRPPFTRIGLYATTGKIRK